MKAQPLSSRGLWTLLPPLLVSLRLFAQERLALPEVPARGSRDQSAAAHIREAAQGLEDLPDDPEANLVLARNLCVVEGDFRGALPLLASSNDPRWAEIAREELRSPEHPLRQAALGDAWWHLAAAGCLAAWQMEDPYQEFFLRQDLQEAAVRRYEQALPLLAGSPEEPAVLSRLLLARRGIDVVTEGGGAEAPEFREVCPGPGVVIGIRVGVGPLEGRRAIRFLQPIYLTRRGRVLGGEHGLRLPGIREKEVEAMPGYAVAGLVAARGSVLDGFRLCFERLDGRRLDPGDAYEGPWLGRRRGGAVVRIDCRGRPAIGLTGRMGGALEALGLVTSALSQEAEGR